VKGGRVGAWQSLILCGFPSAHLRCPVRFAGCALGKPAGQHPGLGSGLSMLRESKLPRSRPGDNYDPAQTHPGTLSLELVVGVDIEADDYTDLDRLIATQSGAEFPTVERGENFAGHQC